MIFRATAFTHQSAYLLVLLAFISSLTLLSVGANAEYNFRDLTITQLVREVDLTGRCVDVSERITVRNDGTKDQLNFYYALPNELETKAITILLEESDGSEITGVALQDLAFKAKYNATLIEFKLESPLRPDRSVTLRIKELYFKRWEPYPRSITLTENQLVRFEDSKYFFTPYTVVRQKVSYKASIFIEYSEDEKVKKDGGRIVYGEYDSIPPYTRESLQLHIENNNPFPILEKSEKKIEVSHWGNIAIEYFNKLYNDGASLKGEFGRITYSKYNQDVGKNGLKSLYAELPYNAWGVFYYDEIGNISTSRASRDSKDKVVKLYLEPRFPILGGWRSNFYVGYNLNPQQYLYTDESSGKFVLKQLFYTDLHDLVSETYELRVVLPEGAYDISVDLPFAIDEESTDVTFSYLDTVGRPTLVFRKNYVTEYHNRFFYVHYRLDSIGEARKPLLLFLVFATFFIVLIILNRAHLKTFSSKKDD